MRRVDVVGMVLAVALMAPATAVAADPPPVPVAPANGRVFSWDEAYSSGVPVVVQAPAGLGYVTVDVARDAAITDSADYLLLDETSPGRYEDTALTFLEDPDTDAGLYYWQASYTGAYDPDTGESPTIVGPVRTFRVAPPYSPPSVSVSVPPKLIAGRTYQARVRYRRGSEPATDRLHLLQTRSSCPSVPTAQEGSPLLSAVVPPAGGEVRVPVRSRRLGTVRLCAYVTSGSVVTRRARDVATVVRRPVSRWRMRRWRLGFSGVGRVRVGMSVSRVEQVTGRSMFWEFGDDPGCELWKLGGTYGLSLMVVYGRIARVEAWRGRWRTTRGIRIGDSERKVRRRYHVHSEPHPYVPAGEYLISGGKRRMIFETGPTGRVTSFRGGRAREVGYIEGCL